MIRATTGGVLRSYRSNLMSSFNTLTKSRDTVLSQRIFNSYAEDPAAAAKAFKLRKARMGVESQYKVCNDVYSKYQSAWSCLDSIDTLIDTENGSSMTTLKSTTLKMLNDPTGDAREQLGTALDQISETIVQMLNQRYGETFIFAGADGHNVPFEVVNVDGQNKLFYRGVDVDVDVYGALEGGVNYDEKTIEDAKKLKYLADEKYFVDIGLGFQENQKGQLIESSGFNASLIGLNFIGYGIDKDGDPYNIYSLVQKMKNISDNANAGSWTEEEYDEFYRLVGKLEDASSKFKTAFTNMDASTTKLKNNLGLLEENFYTLQEQYSDLEDVDLADAITSFVWAQYCYNAALKVGNSILSESLMDYLR